MKRFSAYIGSQFGNPRGIIGKICCLIMNAINKAMYKSILHSACLNEQSTVLDIGYGNGYLIQKLYKKYRPQIYGIDISEDMKGTASKRNSKAVQAGKVRLSVGDCCQMDFEDCFFDAVTTVNTIYFWEDTLQGLSEIHRVLKDGGIFYNVVYSKEWLEKLSYTKQGFKLFTPQEITSMAEKAGFSEVRIKELSHGKSYLIQGVKQT